jgi:hypothetical protein
MTIWYILCSFGAFCPVLVSCTKKNLATLIQPTTTGKIDFSLSRHLNPSAATTEKDSHSSASCTPTVAKNELPRLENDIYIERIVMMPSSWFSYR